MRQLVLNDNGELPSKDSIREYSKDRKDPLRTAETGEYWIKVLFETSS